MEKQSESREENVDIWSFLDKRKSTKAQRWCSLLWQKKIKEPCVVGMEQASRRVRDEVRECDNCFDMEHSGGSLEKRTVSGDTVQPN